MANIMKVVMVYGNPIGDFYGGISTHIKFLTKYLSHFKDLDLVLVTFGEENSYFKKNGIEQFILKKMKFGKPLYPLEIFYDLLRLERIIKKKDPDLIHIQSTSPNFLIFGLYMRSKYPILNTVHGYFNEEYKSHTGIRKIFHKLVSAPIEKYSLSKIPNIIVLSPQLENIVRKITKSNIYTIPNGIDLDHIQSIEAHEKNDYPTVFFLGYLTKGKGVEDLIKAIKISKDTIKDIKLLIGGNGPYMPKLKKMVKDLNLKQNVTFLGLLKERNKFAYMKSIDVFVLPSYWESFPFVLLEAMACEKPIIATNVGGNPYAVTNNLNGFLINPAKPKEIVEKLIYLFQNKKIIEKMGKESKTKAVDFDWKIIANKTKDVYTRISSGENK